MNLSLQKAIIIFTLLLTAHIHVNAQGAFTPGNICVLQSGDTTIALANTGNTAIIREFSTTGTNTNWYVVPNAPASKALILSGTATSDGSLSLSNDSTCLVFGGYSQVLAGNTVNISSSAGSLVPRAIGRITGCGKYDRIAISSTFHSSGNIRGAATDGCGNNYWSTGNSGGVNYWGNSATAINAQNVKANCRAICAQNGKIYFSTASASGTGVPNLGIYQMGAGMSTAGGQTITSVINTGATSLPSQFTFNPAGTVCYVADQNNTAASGGVKKYVYSAGAWSLAYTITVNATVGAFAVISDFNGATPNCYAVTNENAGLNKLVKFVDNGAATPVGGVYTPSITILANCPPNAWFRGLAFSPKTMQVNSSASTQPTCASNAGTASFNTKSGYCTPTYDIAPLAGTQTTAGNFTGLPGTVAGTTYTITSTDVSGCTLATTITMINPNNLVLNITLDSILCNGGTGGFTATATGGVAPLQFKLNSGAFSTNNVFTNQSNGNYTITVQDANGCSATGTGALVQPSPLSLVISPSVIFCTGGVSTINCYPSGGSAPYQYQLNGGTYQTVDSFTNNPIGGYTVQVKDANNCTATDFDTIIAPPPFSLYVSSNPIACFGGVTVINPIPFGGYGSSFEYSLNGGTYLTVDSITNVSAGNYTVTVKDNYGCLASTTENITQPPGLTSTLTATPILCNGGTSDITVSASGGIPSITFALNGGTYQSANSFNGNVANTYTVASKDANNCLFTNTIIITQPNTLIAAIDSTKNVLCHSNATGYAAVNVTGGTMPYSYSWNGSASTTNTASNLLAGSYTCNVIDANNCTTAIVIAITQPSALSAIGVFSPILCNGDSAIVSVNATGGTAPYNTFTAKLGAGPYVLTISDANNCSANLLGTMLQPSLLNANAIVSAIACNGGNASVLVSATGGTAPYSGVGTFNAPAGNYTYIVTDTNGCIDSVVQNITQPTVLALTNIAGTISCNGGNTTVQIAATGGTAPYIGTGIFTVSAGNYKYVVTDANGCKDSVVGSITAPTVLALSYSALDINCFGGNANVTVSATGGTTPYNGTGLFYKPAGTHNFVVEDANGCKDSISVNITQPSLLTIAGTASKIACHGDSSTIAISANGGTSPYTGVGSFVKTAGTYIFTITDNYGCTADTTIVITQPSALNISTIVSGILCNGGATSVNIVASGGTSPYVGAGSFTAAAGLQNYSVTDDNGCTVDTSFTIIEPSALKAMVVANSILCHGDSTTLIVSAIGGSSPYTGTNTITVAAGTYTQTVVDNNGCIDDTIITITQPNALQIAISAGSISCNGGTASVVVSANGGTTPYNGDGAFIATAGTSTYMVMDDNGCAAQDSITLTQPSAINVSAAVLNLNCTYDSSLVAITATGGTSPYIGVGNFMTPFGTVTYTVTDDNGCVGNINFYNVDPLVPAPAVFVTASITDICSNSSTTLYSNHPSSGAVYNWLPVNVMDSTATVAPTSTTTYTVYATDGSCVYTSSITIHVNPASGDLAQSNLLSSVPGTSCDTALQSDGLTVSYYDANCNLLATVNDASGGNLLGDVISCVTVDTSVQTLNGQPYLARHYSITPANDGPADVTLYFTQDDFNDYNAHANVVNGAYPMFPISGNNADTNIAHIRVATYHGTSTLGGSNVEEIIPTFINFANGIWSITFPVNHFSAFYLHGVNPNNVPLQIGDIALNASNTNMGNSLTWQVLSENNIANYVVLQGSSIADLHEIGIVMAKGNSTQVNSYQYLHHNPSVTANYYQIKQVDASGKVKLSNVAFINNTASSAFSIYPNPILEDLHIQTIAEKQTFAQLQIQDATARIVYSEKLNIQKGLNSFTLDFSTLANGVYTVTITDGKALKVVQKVNKL